MCRKGENIRKRKDGRWEARYIKYRDPEGKIHYGSLYGKTSVSYTHLQFEVRLLISQSFQILMYSYLQ